MEVAGLGEAAMIILVEGFLVRRILFYQKKEPSHRQLAM
jgi:hypothetical protein